jgi:predicted nuclease of predicted toxin-antitoxin system
VRFKLGENLPVELAAEIRRMGHDTDTVAEEGLCGEADPTVVEAASISDRILLTLDKGIADARGERRAGVVLFRPVVEPSYASSWSGSPGSHRWILQVG